MGKWFVVACLFVAACRPMYGDPAPHLKDPPHRNPPKGWNDEPVAEKVYVEECNVDFSAPPTTKRQTKAAEQKVVAGDSAAAESERATDPKARVDTTKRSLQEYRDALIADPFNAQATLKLALAYDKVLRKGCAIAMLKRLDKLAENPKFNAEPVKDQVVDNEQWFKPYRNEALRAIGH
ncbi:MAG TPA: hypothetical protein VMZ53_16970 [Kofleriaceae bacterium]|nr:hypothetical protein [Kofleriaceae bacterium]